MHEPSCDGRRELVDVVVLAVDGVVLQDGYDFVIGLLVVEQPEPAYGPCTYDDVAVGHVLLREHADVQGIPVTFYVLPAQRDVGEFRHLGCAVCARKESV